LQGEIQAGGNLKLAIILGGWHWPAHPFAHIAAQAKGADLYAVGHRSPDLPIVREEKRETLEHLSGELAHLDRELYRGYASTDSLRSLGWQYQEEPNTMGDWEFFNQWLATHDYRKYDVVLNCHDDTYFRRDDLFSHLKTITAPLDSQSPRNERWLVLTNGVYPEAPIGYLRGSFEFWRREMLDMLGGKIPLGDVGLTRVGKTDTPEGLDALSEWNATCDPLRRFMVDQKLTDRITYLSQHYRVSPWVIEGERGLLSNQGGAPWSFAEGLKVHTVGAMA
jgi:hypothetical protein